MEFDNLPMTCIKILSMYVFPQKIMQLIPLYCHTFVTPKVLCIGSVVTATNIACIDLARKTETLPGQNPHLETNRKRPNRKIHIFYSTGNSIAHRTVWAVMLALKNMH